MPSRCSSSSALSTSARLACRQVRCASGSTPQFLTICAICGVRALPEPPALQVTEI